MGPKLSTTVFLKTITFGVGAPVLLAIPASAVSAECHVREAVGRVEILRRAQDTDVQIERAGGSSEVAVPYHYLCAGDILRKRGKNTVVGVRWDGTANVEYMDTNELAVSQNRAATLTSIGRDWLIRLGILSGKTSRAFAKPTFARSNEPGGVGKELKLTRFSHSYEGVQRIAQGRAVLAVAWEGSAISIRMSEKDGRFLSGASVLGQPWSVVNAPAETQQMKLEFTAADRSVSEVEIVRDAAIPSLPGSTSSEDRDEDLARALWLIFEAGPEWRLEGMSRLQELSNTNLVADHIWSSLASESRQDASDLTNEP